MMSSSSVALTSTIQQASNAGVLPPPAHVAPNAAAVVGHLEESSRQQDPDSSGRRPSRRLIDFLGGRHEGSPDQISPDESSGSGIRLPPPVKGRPMDVVGDRRDEDAPDLLSPNSGSRRPGAAPARHWMPEVIGFSVLTFNSAMAAYRS
ncbi:unnamed protein product [Miscanthus lutarioriparius]|uniref:Uncharacterized protein n=1 Tax=Miscanthus lutarioriparius TaxID=422564 RepID=A0A811PTM2_9POAL|nr:unnamed protein product [Miscanthus lutarioriparius]